MLRNYLIIVFVLFFIGCSSKVEYIDDWDYAKQAQNTSNIKLCLKIDSENLRNSCKDSLNYALSIKDKDVSFCDKIVDELKMEECRKYIIFGKAKEQKEPNVCNELKDSASCKDDFNMNIALRNMDVFLCNKIVQEDKKNSCLSDVVPIASVLQDDINLCEILVDNKEKCMDYFYYYKSIDDKQLCEKISEESLKDSCGSDTLLRNRLVSMDILAGTKRGRISRISINTPDDSIWTIIR